MGRQESVRGMNGEGRDLTWGEEHTVQRTDDAL